MMKRIPTLAILGAVACLSSCAQIAEKAVEGAVEKAIESESGEDVDIDFGDGEIKVTTDEGEVVINADGDGDSGTIKMTDDEGNETVMEVDGDTATITNDDGEVIAETGTGTELPEGFPADIKFADGMELTGKYAFDTDNSDRKTYSVALSGTGDVQGLREQAVERLEAAGYTFDNPTISGDIFVGEANNGSWKVNVMFAGVEGTANHTYTLEPIEK